MQLQDAIHAALITQGYTGNLNDQLLAYYLAGGATSLAISDAQAEFLVAQGATPAHVNDMWFEILRAAGYTGSLSDMFYAFWQLTYLLRTTFNTAADQTFIDGQVLDTEAEGILDGALKHLLGTTGGSDLAQIISGEVVFGEGNISGNAGTSFVTEETYVHEVGKAFYAKIVSPSTGKLGAGISLTANNTLPLTRQSRFLFSSLTSLLVNDGVFSNVSVATITADTEYEVMQVGVVGGYIYFLKGGAFSEWEVVYISNTANIDTGYFAVINQNLSGPFRKMLVPDALYIDQTMPTLIVANETQQTLFADSFLSGVFTTPASGVDPLEIRFRVSDANNYWMVKITPGTVGTDTELIKVVAGTPTTVATADIDYTSSTLYSGKLSYNGDASFTFWVDDTEALTYAGPDAFNETEPDVKLLFNLFTSVSFDGYAKSGYTFEGIS